MLPKRTKCALRSRNCVPLMLASLSLYHSECLWCQVADTELNYLNNEEGAAGAGSGVPEPSAQFHVPEPVLASFAGSQGAVLGLLSSPDDLWRNGKPPSSSGFLLRVRRLHQDAPGNLPSHLVGQLAHGWTTCRQTSQVPSPSRGFRYS